MLKDLEQEHSKQQEKLQRGTSLRSQPESIEEADESVHLTPVSKTLPAGSRGQSRADVDGWCQEVASQTNSHGGFAEAGGKVQVMVNQASNTSAVTFKHQQQKKRIKTVDPRRRVINTQRYSISNVQETSEFATAPNTVRSERRNGQAEQSGYSDPHGRPIHSHRQSNRDQRINKKPLGLSELLQDDIPEEKVALGSGSKQTRFTDRVQGHAEQFNPQKSANDVMRMENHIKQYKLFHHQKTSTNLKHSLNSLQVHDVSQAQAVSSNEQSLLHATEHQLEHCNTARPGQRNPQLRAVHLRMGSLQTQSQTKSISKYQKPYPGFAFCFDNVDSYTKKRNNQKLSPLKTLSKHLGTQYCATNSGQQSTTIDQQQSWKYHSISNELTDKNKQMRLQFLGGEQLPDIYDLKEDSLLNKEIQETPTLSCELASTGKSNAALKRGVGQLHQRSISSGGTSDLDDNDASYREEKAIFVQRGHPASFGRMKLIGRMGSEEQKASFGKAQQAEQPQTEEESRRQSIGLNGIYNLPRLKIKNMHDETHHAQHRQTLQHFNMQNIQLPNNTARAHYSQNMQKRSVISNVQNHFHSNQNSPTNYQKQALGERMQPRTAARHEASNQQHNSIQPRPNAAIATRKTKLVQKLRTSDHSEGLAEKAPTGYHKTYSPPRGQHHYKYEVGENEFAEEMVQMSGGNKYHEGTNPLVGKFINSIQGSIRISDDIKTQMKETSTKLFDKMKKEKNQFLQTLIQGEHEGHCKGISTRMDPRLKDKQRQNQQRMKMIHEEQLEQVRKMKRQKDKERLEGQRQRIQERLNQLGESAAIAPKIHPKANNTKPNAFLSSFVTLKSSMRKTQTSGDNQGLALQDEVAGAQTQPSRRKVQIKLENEAAEQPASVNDNGDEIELLLDQEGNKKQADMSNSTQNTIESASKDDLESKKGTVAFHNSIKKSSTTSDALKSKALKADRAKVLQQAMGFKNLSKEHVTQIESIMKNGESKVFEKLHQYFTSQQYLKTQAQNQKISERVKMQKLFTVGFKQLGLNDDIEIENFFKGMCDEGKHDIKYAKLNREHFKAFMQDHYSPQFSERIILFLENQFEHFSRISFADFQDILLQFLNAGPDCYRKLVFATLGIQNPGRICEHDIFTVLEQFKQKETYFFYKDLIARPDVPRDFQTMVDDSDKNFFNAFARDTKVVAHIINLRKRMMGIIDMDTISGIEDDFNEDNFNLNKASHEQYEKDVCSQIDYIAQVVNKRGGQSIILQAFEMMIKAKSLQEVRNKLCMIVAKYNLLQLKQPANKRSSMSTTSETKQDKPLKKSASEAQSTINFQAPAAANPCMGKGVNPRTGKALPDCIFMTYEDFSKLVEFRYPNELSSLAEDLVNTLSNGRINLRKFEAEMQHYRETGSGGFQGTLQFSEEDQPYNYVVKKEAPLKPISFLNSNISKANDSKRDQFQKSTGAYASARETATNGMTNEQADNFNTSKGFKPAAFVQLHKITTPFQIQDNYQGGEFIGKILFKVKEAKKSKQSFSNAERPNPTDTSQSNQQELEVPQEDKQKASIDFEEVRELFSYKEHFGLENFFNIFKCFYLLSNIPKDAQNNPFAFYMDAKSTVRGFKACFGIDIEEIAIRFHHLFIQPVNKTSMQKIGILRFFYTVAQICCVNHPDKNYMKIGFNFYDYDGNGSIGSVDIINLYNSLPIQKVLKINRKYQKLYLLKQEQFQLRKIEKETGKKNKRIKQIAFDAEISDAESSEPENNGLLSEESNSDEEEEAAQLAAKRRARKSISKKGEKIVKVDEEFETAIRINNSWNKFLFEVQLIRDYFVEEAVLPKASAANQRFLNLKIFEHKFANGIMEKYGGDAPDQQFQCPAMIFFLRKRFISAQQMDGSTLAYGSSLEQQDQEHCATVVVPNSRRKGGLSQEELLINAYCSFLDSPQAPVTAEFKQTLAALYQLIQVPSTVHSFDINSAEGF